MRTTLFLCSIASALATAWFTMSSVTELFRHVSNTIIDGVDYNFGYWNIISVPAGIAVVFLALTIAFIVLTITVEDENKASAAVKKYDPREDVP